MAERATDSTSPAPEDGAAVVPDPVPVLAADGPAISGSAMIADQVTDQAPTGGPVGAPGTTDRDRVGTGYIWLVVLATLGGIVALVGPIGYSLAVLVSRISPGNPGVLGYITGTGALTVIVVGPLFGIISDRTCSRFGRRRPWIVLLTLVGLLGLLVVGTATNLPMAMLGWAVTQLGFGVGALQVTSSLGDRLPESQRGKVAGLTGVATMLGSIIGVALASPFANAGALLFLVPGAVGAVLVLLFAVLVKEPDSRGLPQGARPGLGSVLAGYGYDVRRYADFSWNWLGRFLFNFGLTLATTFTTFLFADRLGAPVSELGSLIALSGLLAIVGTVGGAAISGFLSDRLKRRKVFILLAGILFTVGAVIAAVAPDLTVLLVGQVVMNFGLGIFSAVDQALYLDVLPEKDTQAGRFIAINQFSTSIPQFAAPLVAPLFLAIGVAAGSSNYPLLYVVAGMFSLAGGAIIVSRVRSVR